MASYIHTAQIIIMEVVYSYIPAIFCFLPLQAILRETASKLTSFFGLLISKVTCSNRISMYMHHNARLQHLAHAVYIINALGTLSFMTFIQLIAIATLSQPALFTACEQHICTQLCIENK